LMDEYGYDYDEAGEIAYDSDKYYEVIGIDPGGMGDESRNMDEEVVEEEGIMRAANGGVASQGGGLNYNPSKMVSVPTEFRARKNSPNTKLAYITDDEAGILKALKPDTPHKGPEGIPNYDSFDISGGYTSGRDIQDTGPQAGQAKGGGSTFSGNEQTKQQNLRNLKAAETQTKKNVKTWEKEAKKKKEKPIVPPSKPDSKPNVLQQINPFPVMTHVLGGLSGSKMAMKNNMFQRQNYLRGLTPEQQVEVLEDLAKIGIGTDNPMGIDRNIQRGMGTSNYLDPEQVNKGVLGTGLGAGKFITDIDFGGPEAKAVINTVTGGGYDDYLDRGNKGGGEGGGEQDPCKGPNPPAYCFTGGKNQKDEEEVEEEEWYMPLAFRAEGGRVGKAFGGIMGDDGRRAYGLGSIFKKVKKIFKSPLAKAALLGLGGYKMGLFGGGKNFKLTEMIMGKGGKGGLLNWAKDNPFGAIAGASALSGLVAAKDYKKYDDWNNEDDGTGLGDLNKYRNYYSSPLSQRADGGRVGAQEGGLMDMGGMEKDYREDGGFVPIGGKEKADDVPARLSKNEFVFTADAVRGAGEGDIDKGAEVMYNMMKNLEAGGGVSEETQGLDGAREMFQTSQRLEEVL